MQTLHATRRVLSVAITCAIACSMSGCLSASPFHTQTAAAPQFEPEAFFRGATHGVGTLEQRGKAGRKLHVEGTGRWGADSVFRLDQKVVYDDGTTESRTWFLHRKGAQDYTGSLSDASGTIDGKADGNFFHLSYLVRQPAVYMDQVMYLQPDGRTVLNVATVSVLGVPWARLSETITRSR
jgi:catechol 2,3-dioxygenase-like lactoylglutathione lyase family enzyme